MVGDSNNCVAMSFDVEPHREMAKDLYDKVLAREGASEAAEIVLCELCRRSSRSPAYLSALKYCLSEQERRGGAFITTLCPSGECVETFLQALEYEAAYFASDAQSVMMIAMCVARAVACQNHGVGERSILTAEKYVRHIRPIECTRIAKATLACIDPVARSNALDKIYSDERNACVVAAYASCCDGWLEGAYEYLPEENKSVTWLAFALMSSPPDLISTLAPEDEGLVKKHP